MIALLVSVGLASVCYRRNNNVHRSDETRHFSHENEPEKNVEMQALPPVAVGRLIDRTLSLTGRQSVVVHPVNNV